MQLPPPGMCTLPPKGRERSGAVEPVPSRAGQPQTGLPLGG